MWRTEDHREARSAPELILKADFMYVFICFHKHQPRLMKDLCHNLQDGWHFVFGGDVCDKGLAKDVMSAVSHLRPWVLALPHSPGLIEEASTSVSWCLGSGATQTEFTSSWATVISTRCARHPSCQNSLNPCAVASVARIFLGVH